MKKPLSERFSKGLKQWLAVLPFLAVGMTLFIVFVLYPQIKNIYIALTNYDVGVKTINKFNPIPYSTLKNSYFVVYRRGLGNI